MVKLDPVELDVFCIAETDLAILVDIDGEEIWIPRSQIEDDSEVVEKGDEGTLIISGWLAEQEGL